MNFFSHWLKENQGLLKTILSFAENKGVKLYLVGGALRDILLEREKKDPDFDFCLKNNAINFSRALAQRIKAGFVVLDKVHGCGRIVKKLKDKTYTLDFSDLRGKTLEDDLFHRDFGINSMAASLKELVSASCLTQVLIDPYNGKKDLKNKVVRLVNKKAFSEDPLRILRAFSMASLFNLAIAKDTLRQIDLEKNKLALVSSERIRDEIFKILSGEKSHTFLIHLDSYGILDLIIPEIKSMRQMKKRSKFNLDVWGHSLESVKKLELIVKSFGKNAQIRDYLQEEISSGRRRLELIKLASLLHDVAKPRTFKIYKDKVTFYGHDSLGAQIIGQIGTRLRLANEEVYILKKIVSLHLRPGFMVTNPVLTRRAKFRFFRDAAGEAVSVLLIGLADERATRGYLILDKARKRYERSIPGLLREYFLRQKETKPGRLINGDDLTRRFKLEPSPLIGKILKELEESQAIGKIKTQAAGFKAAAKIIKENLKKC